jgi:hypothetical protein
MNAPTDTQILDCIAPQSWFVEATQKRCAMELRQLAELTGTAEERCAEIALRMTDCLESCKRLLQRDEDAVKREIPGVLRTAGEIRREFETCREAYIEGPFRYLLPAEPAITCCDSMLRAQHAELREKGRRLVDEIIPRYLKSLKRTTDMCAEQNERSQ